MEHLKLKKTILTVMVCMLGLCVEAKETSYEDAYKIITKGEVIGSNHDNENKLFSLLIRHKGKLYFCYSGLKFSTKARFSQRNVATEFPFASSECFDSDTGFFPLK